MALSPPGSRSTSERHATAAATAEDCESWPYLDQAVLRPSRSRKVCMTCHWFRHHAGAECIPVLTCQLHQGLIAQGEPGPITSLSQASFQPVPDWVLLEASRS